MFHVPEKFRIKTGYMGNDKSYGNNGQFEVKTIKFKRLFRIIVSDEEWEHVSVSLADRCPTWDEMSFIKDLFWGEDDLVIQIHPIKSEYINNCVHCLHLWRKSGTNKYCETPPKIMVGI